MQILRGVESLPNAMSTAEVIYQPLWDSCFIEPGDYSLIPLTLNFFGIPIGIGNKSDADTNMYLSSQLPNSQQFYCTGFEIFFVPKTNIDKAGRAETIHILNHGVFEFVVGNRVVLRMAPLAALPPSFPMYAAYDDQKLREILLSRPIESGGDMIKREESPRGFEIVPLWIPKQRTFYAEIKLRDLVITMGGKLTVIVNGFLYNEAI